MDVTETLSAAFPFWQELTDEQQTLLAAHALPKRYVRGDMLHRGSADCVGLLLVVSGRLRVYTLSEDGKELTLYRLLPGDICLFSASCILASIQFDVMVSAEADSSLLNIPAELYKRLMGESVAVANYTNQLMASRFTDVMWLMDQILSKKLDTRLAALLLEERALCRADTLSITHELLANHLGSAREVVTRMLKYFQEEGLVTLGRGTITLSNVPALNRLAEKSLR